jgi:hypothetical protein
MRRNTSENLETAGQDSFVDVVTNLVGIMIVLVIIVGVRAKHVWIDPSAARAVDASSSKAAVPSAALAELQKTAGGMEADVHRVAEQVALVEQEFNIHWAEREQLATLIAAGEHELAERRGKLETGSRADFGLKQRAAALERELGDNEQLLNRVENERPPAIELKHYLTPLSRTVFGKEVHFRLSAGRIAYVPLEELVDEAKSSIREDMLERTSPTAMTEHERVVGPYAGFEAHYSLAVEPGRLSLVEMEFVPVTGETGEAVGDALKPTSEFRRRLAGHDPSQTTATIWVYPDSFPEFRTIKDELYRLGYAAAARPLPPGRNVAASSDHGSHSSAQ